MMTEQEVRQQSQNAYDQWCVQWRDHAKRLAPLAKKSIQDFIASGVGRAVLCVANGFSLEENIETLKANWQKCDILCCDKTLGALLDHGIKPTFCMVCDANVVYSEYMEKWKDQLQDTILMMNVCGNPEWAEKGNWKDKYFFINKDVLHSELEFAKLSGCPNFIPAGTNVSNAMIVLLTQSDENGARNFFGYDKILLVGYDYCWRDGKYYAFDGEANGKNNYMRHMNLVDSEGEYVHTSGNLYMSLKWIIISM